MWPSIASEIFFFLYIFVFLLKACKLFVRIKTQWNCRVCAQVNMVDHNGSCKHSKVTVQTQSWTMESKKSCGGKNPTAINRLDHTIQCVAFKSISIPAFLTLWPVEMWGKILMLMFLPVLIRPALMGCALRRNCQMFLGLFTKPTLNWGDKCDSRFNVQEKYWASGC